MKNLKQIMEVFEASNGNKDYNDIKFDGGLVRNVPFFDKEGNTISYDEALKLYGFDGLADDIWNDEKYTNQVLNYIKKYELEVE